MVTVAIASGELGLAREMAAAACLGGHSEVRRREDRSASLSTDQLVGQVGTIAGHKYLFGDLRLYRLSRWHANQNPETGDGGYDVPGCQVDIKSSLMRASEDPMDYRLLVRPRERHAGWTYILALVPSIKMDRVHLVGWTTDEKLPRAPEAVGIFAGAFVVPARSLNPMMPLRWVV